jgi:hypothetical protein
MKSIKTITVEIANEFLMAQGDREFDIHQGRAERILKDYIYSCIQASHAKPSEDEDEHLYADF